MKSLMSYKLMSRSWKKLFSRIADKEKINSSLSQIFSNMAILTGGNVIAKGLSFIAVPVISRLYSPEDFGILSLYASSLAMLTPFSSLRYSVTIPLARSERSAVNLIFLCVLIQLALTCFLFLILLFFSRPLFAYLSIGMLNSYWPLLPLGFLGYGIYETLVAWATRTKSFGLIARTNISQSFSSSLIKITLGFFHIRPMGLLLGHFFMQFSGILLLYRSVHKMILALCRGITVSKMRFLAIRYSAFPKFQIPSRFLLALGVQMPVLYFAAAFDAETAGFFGMAVSIVAIPMNLFGQTLSRAYYAEISEIGIGRPLEIKEISISLMKKLIWVSVPFFLIFVFTAPKVFSIVLGERWYRAGVFARYISFYTVTQFVSSPFVHTLNVLEKQDMFFKINLSRVAFISVIFLICHAMSANPAQTIASYSVLMVLHYGMTTFFILKACDR